LKTLWFSRRQAIFVNGCRYRPYVLRSYLIQEREQLLRIGWFHEEPVEADALGEKPVCLVSPTSRNRYQERPRALMFLDYVAGKPKSTYAAHLDIQNAYLGLETAHGLHHESAMSHRVDDVPFIAKDGCKRRHRIRLVIGDQDA